MVQYIDKAAVVAVIEKLKGKISESSSYRNGWQHALRMLELSLNTLEVKEVDLEKEINEQALFYNYALVGIEEITAVAKHFFKLGINARKGE